MAQTRDLVLHAARMILASEGQAAVTPTRLVELSGVARSTIYRHWPDAEAIVRDTMDQIEQELDLYRSGDPATDLRSYLERLRDVLESPSGSLIVSQAEIAERDEQAFETLAGNAQHRIELIRELLADPRSDFDAVHAQLVGPLFMQRYFSRAPITDDLIDAIVASYLLGLPNTLPA